MIRVFDAYGREMFITKQTWRDSVLLGHIEKAWNEPEQLYATIVQSLQDGFVADMVKPAEQLAKIDPDKERGSVVLGVVYREQKRLDDSERVLRQHMQAHGETGIVLTNLAKVYSSRGDEALCLQTLWRGLELDPNQDNGLGWYAAIFREKDGEPGFVAALCRIAALPGSWRARLWLARDALARRQLDEALALYDLAFAMAPRPVPIDMLQQVSGDLGNQAHLVELLRLSEPHFKVEFHGLAVGNNLIKANLDLGRLDAVLALLDQHHAQNRPDWKETLSYWDNELAKTRVAASSDGKVGELKVRMLSGNGPVWLPLGSAVEELFPASMGEPVKVAFLGSTFDPVVSGEAPSLQLSDDKGRLSRALPLFFSEQVHFRGCARVRPLVPWLMGESPAFTVSAVPWTDDAAAGYARAVDSPSDYIVVTHLRTAIEPWHVELRLIRTIDAKCLGEVSSNFAKAQPDVGLLRLADLLVDMLVRKAEMRVRGVPPYYRLPASGDFGHYLIRLEQLLAARCSGMDGTSKSFLHGVRDIIDANLGLCLRQPDNVVIRAVLGQTLVYLKKVHPLAVEEYRAKILLLQKEKPLSALERFK